MYVLDWFGGEQLIQYVYNRQFLTPLNNVDTCVIKAFTVGQAFKAVITAKWVALGYKSKHEWPTLESSKETFPPVLYIAPVLHI